MTISQSLVLVLIVALWSTGNGIDLTNNTTFLILLLISLIALSYATNNSRRCDYNYQSINDTSNSLLNNLFA